MIHWHRLPAGGAVFNGNEAAGQFGLIILKIRIRIRIKIKIKIRIMSRRENQKCALENGAGLDGGSLELLAEDLAPLDELARQLAWRVMRYVVDGAEAKVLAELAALRMAGPKLRLYGLALPARRSRSESRSASVPPAKELGARRRFFQSVRCADAAFFVRLGRVYEAASRPLRVRMARAFGDPDLDWLQVLLIEATELTLNAWPRRCRACAVLTSDLIEAMLEAEGQPRDLLVRAAFVPPKGARTRFGAELEAVWERLPGLGASAARHPAAVLAALSQADLKKQLEALDLMKKSRTPAAGFAGKLFELVFSPSKRVRELAAGLLAQAPSTAGPFLREKAGRGESAQRARAVRLLWEAEGEKARAFLAAQLMEEQSKPKKSNKVWRALEEVLSPGPAESGPDEALPPELPGWWKKALGPKAGRAARLGEANAVAPLLAALRKEKDDATRSAMMTSLARFGRSARTISRPRRPAGGIGPGSGAENPGASELVSYSSSAAGALGGRWPVGRTGDCPQLAGAKLPTRKPRTRPAAAPVCGESGGSGARGAWAVCAGGVDQRSVQSGGERGEGGGGQGTGRPTFDTSSSGD